MYEDRVEQDVEAWLCLGVGVGDCGQQLWHEALHLLVVDHATDLVVDRTADQIRIVTAHIRIATDQITWTRSDQI